MKFIVQDTDLADHSVQFKGVLLCRTPTAGYYGAALVGTFLYFTDWKAVLHYVPFYGSKFDREPPR